MSIYALVLFAAASLATDAPAISGNIDPANLYGGEIEFDVVRKGKKIGSHLTRFTTNADQIRVSTQMKMKVPVLLLFNFKMNYRADEIWSGGSLQGLDVNVSAGGKKNEIIGSADKGQFNWISAEETWQAEQPIFPTTHWNVAVLDRSTVLNTLTGRLNKVEIEFAGPERIQTASGMISANRYRYSGELETDVWYTRDGRWVKLQFEAKDGSTIEYVCRQCGLKSNQSLASD